MTKVRIDTDYSTQRFARDTGLEKLGQRQLKPLADDQGVVSQKQLERMATGAGLDKDGVLSPAERKRIDGYLKDRQPIVVGTGGSAVSARAAVKPAEGYIEVEHKLRGTDLVVEFDIGLYQGGSSSVRDEHSREIVLQGFTPNGDNAIDFHRYGKDGADASVGYATGGSGAGYLMGIADAKKGAVLVNLSAAGAVAKQAPEVRALFSPRDLADDPRIKALARKEGLDPKKLKVDVTSVSFHSDFQKVGGGGGGHPTMHTLLLSIELREEGSRKKPREAELTALVQGNPAKSLAKLDVADLEVGAQHSWGFVYPPSIKFDDDDKKPAGTGGGTRDTGVRTGGGGENPSPTPRRRGGGGEGSPVVTGGGGE